MKSDKNNGMLTFGGHLEVLRRMIFRILGVAGVTAIVVFCMKDQTWRILLAPSEWSFITYTWIENIIHDLGAGNFCFGKFHVDLIATDLSSQFMTHLTTSLYIGLLVASPYVLYELFRFVSPALFENERKYATRVIVAVYFLFIVGILINYFILFPISFRFLGTYQVAEQVRSTITLDSYISTFISLTLLMGIVFQLPVLAFILGKMGIIDFCLLSKYRKHAFLVIVTISAIITPGQDILTLTVVTLPLYFLYEVSLWIVKKVSNEKS